MDFKGPLELVLLSLRFQPNLCICPKFGQLIQKSPKVSSISMKYCFVGSTEAPSKVLLLFFLLSDWLKSNHLRSQSNVVFRHFFAPYL